MPSAASASAVPGPTTAQRRASAAARPPAAATARSAPFGDVTTTQSHRSRSASRSARVAVGRWLDGDGRHLDHGRALGLEQRPQPAGLLGGAGDDDRAAAQPAHAPGLRAVSGRAASRRADGLAGEPGRLGRPRVGLVRRALVDALVDARGAGQERAQAQLALADDDGVGADRQAAARPQLGEERPLAVDRLPGRSVLDGGEEVAGGGGRRLGDSTASAPWPTWGTITSTAISSTGVAAATSSRMPSTSSAAAAITMAPPSGTLPRRVWMLPRSSTNVRSGRSTDELRPAAHRAGGDGRAVRQVVERAADQRVARIAPLA